jgi:HSP20 family protein
MTDKESTSMLASEPKSRSFTDQLVEPLSRLRNEVDRLFEDFPMRMPALQFGRIGANLALPAIEMSETDTSYRLSVEVPGIDAKDINLTVENNSLVISGEKKEEREEKKANYLYSERSYGSFERRVALPKGTDPSSITAKAKDGLLQISIAKAEKAAPESRKIAIES